MDVTERHEIAERVTSARLNAGWSKEEAARRAGISSITLKRVEDAQPVQDTKMAAIMAMVTEAEMSHTDRIAAQRARAEAKRYRLEEMREELDRRAATDPEAAAVRKRISEEMAAERRANALWPEGVDPDNAGAVRTARTMLWQHSRVLRAMEERHQEALRDLREAMDLTTAQLIALNDYVGQIDPDGLDEAAVPEDWRERRNRRVYSDLSIAVDSQMPLAARRGMNIGRATQERLDAQAEATDVIPDDDADPA